MTHNSDICGYYQSNSFQKWAANKIRELERRIHDIEHIGDKTGVEL